MIFKRAFDILSSSAGLIILSPFFLLAALAIRLESPGPAFFRQTRVGLRGIPFRIHKFRTMYITQPADAPQITIGDDPRITRVGKFLRHYKIDELPQLIDVLIGKMSIVGPRPEVPKYVSHYPPDAKSIILSVRPGITDNASLLFINESEILSKVGDSDKFYLENILPKKIEIYIEYVKNVSLLSDLSIIARTLLSINNRKAPS